MVPRAPSALIRVFPTETSQPSTSVDHSQPVRPRLRNPANLGWPSQYCSTSCRILQQVFSRFKYQLVAKFILWNSLQLDLGGKDSSSKEQRKETKHVRCFGWTCLKRPFIRCGLVFQSRQWTVGFSSKDPRVLSRSLVESVPFARLA